MTTVARAGPCLKLSTPYSDVLDSRCKLLFGFCQRL